MQTTTRSRKQPGKQQASGSEVHTHIIELGNEDCLLEEPVLKANAFPSALKKSAWEYPTLKLVGYKDGTLELTNAWNGETYRLMITVMNHQLHVGCNCGHRHGLLCLHAYNAIRRLLQFRSAGYFQQFLPGREAALALNFQQYFKTEWRHNDLHITEKKDLGRLYLPVGQDPVPLLEEALRMPVANGRSAGEKELAPCYFIMHSRHHRMLPVLIPALGKRNKEGTAIKTFYNFLTGTEKEFDDLLTEDQRLLNRLCLQLWKVAEALPGRLLSSEEPADSGRLEELFRLWKKAWALLQHQPFVFLHPLRRQSDLKGKPVKRYAWKINLSSATPSIGFQLIKNEHCAQLRITARYPHGRPIRHFDSGLPFFLRIGEQLLLLSSLKDAAIVEWMQGMGQKLTIFHCHYTAFEQNILNRLKKHYNVEQATTQRSK